MNANAHRRRARSRHSRLSHALHHACAVADLRKRHTDRLRVRFDGEEGDIENDIEILTSFVAERLRSAFTNLKKLEAMGARKAAGDVIQPQQRDILKNLKK